MRALDAVFWSLVAVIPMASAAGPFPIEREAGGCLVERLAGGDGVSYNQFFGASPDGRKLALGWEVQQPDKSWTRGAFLLDLKTGEREALPLNNAASFSPDGKKLVTGFYSGSRLLRTEIVEFDLAGRQLRFLAPDAQGDWLPSYFPDGRSVLFNSTRTGASDLYRVDVASGKTTQLTNDPRYEAHASASPDGKSVLYHRQQKAADYAVMQMMLAGGTVEILGDGPGEESYPAASPRGDIIAFSSDRDAAAGKNDIYLMAADGAMRRKLTADPVNDAYASWSPDGRYLYYNAQHEDGTRILRTAILGDDCRRK
jgi:TolB protein